MIDRLINIAISTTATFVYYIKTLCINQRQVKGEKYDGKINQHESTKENLA